MEEKVAEFISFCTEMYAKKNNISANTVAIKFCETGAFEFLENNYLELHTQGKEFLISLIEDFIKERNEK